MAEYTTLIFDCDGVVLNSNKVKTEAFYQATLPFGKSAAQAMVDYHVAKGGVSRYKKFDYFLERIVLNHAEQKRADLESLLQAYADHVREGLLNCEIAPALGALRQHIPNTRWLIVSGGDQAELRNVLTERGIAEWFDGGIFGSPDSKDKILARELACANIRKPALFLGDSKYDYRAASTAGLDFVFLSDWSEIEGWKAWVSENQLSYIRGVHSLLDR
ncbi:HAD family hydrolase [Wenzhouxiangella sp. EGI_FJ10305]|uniref:HAD family hydrolase n=1 Tax=Wenzhouxiangella sp. EGI_FJ10305 TaxID=3243768 RepID=UPI0035E079DA